MDATPDLLAKLLARLDALEAKVASLERPAAATAMVEAIYREFGNRTVVLAEVAKVALAKPELHAAITAALGAGWTVRKLGKLFARLRLQDLGGYMITQPSRIDRAGAMWTISPPPRVSASKPADPVSPNAEHVDSNLATGADTCGLN